MLCCMHIYQHKHNVLRILLSYVVSPRSNLYTNILRNLRNILRNHPKYSFLAQSRTGVRSGDGETRPRREWKIGGDGPQIRSVPRFDSSICSAALESSQMLTGWSPEATSESGSAARNAISWCWNWCWNTGRRRLRERSALRQHSLTDGDATAVHWLGGGGAVNRPARVIATW